MWIGRRESQLHVQELLKGMSMEIKSVMSPGLGTLERAEDACRAYAEAEERLKSMERDYPLRDDPLYHEAKLATMLAFVKFCEAMSLHDTKSVERYRTSLAGQQSFMDDYKREYFPGGCHGRWVRQPRSRPAKTCMIPAGPAACMPAQTCLHV